MPVIVAIIRGRMMRGDGEVRDGMIGMMRTSLITRKADFLPLFLLAKDDLLIAREERARSIVRRTHIEKEKVRKEKVAPSPRSILAAV